jgi:hypothetical protein
MGKNIINEELTKMKYLLGYKRGLVISEQEMPVDEASEVMSQTGDILSKAKEMIQQLGVNENPEEIVDTENPTCVPTTGDSEKDGIISRIWDWANDPKNRGSLKQTITSLKDAIFKAKEMESKGEIKEQVGTAALITIGGVALTPSLLIAIGAILLFIIIIVSIVGSSKNKTSCGRRRKLVKKFGMDGNFM